MPERRARRAAGVLAPGAASSSFVDLTQGEFSFTAMGAQAVMPTLRTPISQTQVGATGVDFSTMYTVGRAITTVHSGSVTVTNAVTGAVQAGSTGVTIITELPGSVPPVGTVVPNLVASI